VPDDGLRVADDHGARGGDRVEVAGGEAPVLVLPRPRGAGRSVGLLSRAGLAAH
jgi:hypothetical protein